MVEKVFNKNKIYLDKKYNFFEIFNPNNGTLIRSNQTGTGAEPFRRSYPELIDIGIMGSCEAGRRGLCSKAGVDCYQNGAGSNKANMSLEDYEWLIKQFNGKVFQVALGGAGDPNKHENFADILKLTREYDVIPNLTTSGLEITDDEIESINKYCGAVAVSYYSRLINGVESNLNTLETISKFVDSGCITNIHYVVSKETIDEAIFRFENDLWPHGINAIIFLLYKPVGLGKKDKTIKNDAKLTKFLDLAINRKYEYSIGFDTCFSTALYKNSSIHPASIDSCEAARFSMYIHSDLVAVPCSFDNLTRRYAYKLKPRTIKEAWESDVFTSFLENKSICKSCKKYVGCLGGCGLDLDIRLC